jgi:hypothetical protein
VLLVEGWGLRRCFVGRFRRWEELGWERELAAFLFGMGWDWMGLDGMFRNGVDWFWYARVICDYRRGCDFCVIRGLGYGYIHLPHCWTNSGALSFVSTRW